MKDLETMFSQTDFSKYTDLKSRLSERLFGAKVSEKTIVFPFSRISDEEAEFVNAAQGLMNEDPNRKDRK